MAKEIVVQFPQGSALGKLTPEEIEEFVEKATAHLPKEEHTRLAEQVIVQTASSVSESTSPLRPDDDPVWRRACRN